VSPIRKLDGDLMNSVARIAPEKCAELKSFRIEYDPCAVFTNDRKFSFRVNTESKEVKLPTVAMEYLWCACYTFYVIYQEYCKANQRIAIELDFSNNEKAKEAISLYKWGMAQLDASPPEKWPTGKARPELSSAASEDVRVANELYLCAGAWIMHHEFAHIYHGHGNEPLNNEISREQEAEADKSASEWVLGGVLDDAILKKRGLGVAVAALVITAQDILAGEFKEETHPKSFQRLYDTITPYFQDPDHLIYAFSTVICHLNMAIGGMDIVKNDNETWKGNLESCLVQFSRLTSSC